MSEDSELQHARAMLQLLMRLRRKGAVIERTEATASTPWTIVSPGRLRQGAKETLSVSPRVVGYAREQGWIASDGDPNRLRLTEMGALKLTRGLDLAPSAPPPQHTPSAAPKRATQRKPGIAPIAVTRLRRQRNIGGRPLLSGAASEAADRIAADFIRGQMQPRVTANWDKAILGQRPEGVAPGLGVDLRDSIADAQERVRRALDHVGNDHAGVLIDVCCLDRGLEHVEASRGWPRGAGRVVLGIALNMLAAHYGIVASGPTRGKLDRWGSGDDKPTLDAWR